MVNQLFKKSKKPSSHTDHGVRIDLHCHSIRSRDSILTLGMIKARALELGLDAVGITDHDHLADRKVLEKHSGAILLIPGIEISTADGHLLAFGLDEAPGRSLPLPETVDLIKDQGGVPILPHPFRLGNGVGQEDIEGLPDVMFEGLNGRSWVRYNVRASELGKRLERNMTGGSDAHEPSGIGRAWTLFFEDVQDTDDVLEALHKEAVEPRGEGLTFQELAMSKLKGTLRWTNHYLGRGFAGSGGGRDSGNGNDHHGKEREETL